MIVMKRIVFFLFLLLPPLAGCAGEVMKGKIAEAEENRAALEIQAAELQKRLTELGAENQELLSEQAVLLKERERTRGELAALSARLDEETQKSEVGRSELAAENAELTAENDRLRAGIESAREELALRNVALERVPTEIILPNAGRQTVSLDFGDDAILPPRQEGENIVVELQDRLLFDPESGKLSDDGKRRLRMAVERLAERFPDRTLQIEGHLAPQTAAERSESTPLEQQIRSLQKAFLAAESLAAEKIFPAQRLILAGAGDAKPRVGGVSAEAVERNERIELSLK